MSWLCFSCICGTLVLEWKRNRAAIRVPERKTQMEYKCPKLFQLDFFLGMEVFARVGFAQHGNVRIGRWVLELSKKVI